MASQTQVTDPDETDPKTIVNAKLLRIKSERENAPYDSENDSDSDDSSQQPRQQQFYQDLDNGLLGLPREMYVLELMKLCKNDYNLINDYRIRLADRAKGFPECPDTRLIKRRTSNQTSKQKKCANDCYIINAFINGERSKEIYDVFTSSYSVSNETVIIDDTPEESALMNEFVKPSALAMLTRIQADVAEIALKQKADSILLNDLRSDVKEITVSFRIFHGHLNSILSRMPSEVSAPVTKLQNDLSKISSSLAIMNKKFLDGQTAQDNRHPQPANDNVQHAAKENVCASSKTTDTYASAVSKTEQQVTSATINSQRTRSHINKETSKNIEAISTEQQHNITSPDSMSTTDRSNETTRQEECTPRHENNEDSGWKFIAARRRKTNSYFIGNIDASVDENDVRDYLSDQNIRPTRLTMFYGKYGSSARVNICTEDVYKVESSSFWPEGVTCRKWINKSTYERERDSRRNVSYRDRPRYNSRYRDYRYNDNHKYDDQRSTVDDYDRDIDAPKSFWWSNSNGEIDDWNQ